MKPDELRRIAEIEQRLHPQAKLSDYRKLAYQAQFGPGHSITSALAAREWLLQEATEQVYCCDPIWQSLGEKYGRIHLGPWIGAGYELEPLLKAFLASAHTPDAKLIAAWPNEWPLLARQLDEMGFTSAEDETRPEAEQIDPKRPIPRHSAGYRALYLPHYRVISIEQWLKLKTTYNIGGKK